MLFIHTFLDALDAGLPYTFMFVGVWLIFRLLGDIDLTVEGSLTLGAAVSVALISHGWGPVQSTVLATLCGGAAGVVTAIIHLRLRVILLLSGIVTMIALYSINLGVMGRPNISLIGRRTLFSWTSTTNSMDSDLQGIILLAGILVVILGILGVFLKSEFGLALRAAGANPGMARASGINTGLCVVVFLVISNAFVGLSGAVVAQQQTFADINMGVGVIVIAIASILLGEIFFRRSGSVWFGICGVLLGTVIYYVAVASAIRLGLPPNDLKAFTAALLLAGVIVGFGISRVERELRIRRARTSEAVGNEASVALAAPEDPPLKPVIRRSPANLSKRSRLVTEVGGPILDLREIRVTYNLGLPNQTTALAGIDLSLNRGDFLTVIGSNGAGKSTLVSVVGGSVTATRGRMSIGGTDVTRQAEHQRARRVARVFQDPLAGTCPEFTIAENLALAAGRVSSRSLSPAVTKRRRREFSDYLGEFGLGLEDRLSDRAGQLSGGQRQALSILMAVMEQPLLLLLDEHTAALDPRNQGLLLEMTRELIKEAGCTTIMVTHNMQNAIDYGNRMIMLHRGMVLLSFNEDQKERLTVPELVDHFHNADDAVSDEMLMI